MPKNLPPGPYVICSNHSSYLDIIQMYPILPRTKFMFIGKAELLRWPVINIFFKKMDIGALTFDHFSPRFPSVSLLEAEAEA